LTASCADNKASANLTLARKLTTNLNTAFVGVQRNGPFDVQGVTARLWLTQPNTNGLSNAQVLRPSVTALDVTRRPQGRWLIDFGMEKDLSKLVAFEKPFECVEANVKPTRAGLRRAWHATYWWLFGDPRPAMRKAISNLPRYLVTPQISKHRVFVFVSSSVLTENANIAIARHDDATFGILHSRFHELWSLRMGTSLEDRPRYTNLTTFETFPFPLGLTPADTAHQRTETLPCGAVIPLMGEDLASNQPVADVGHRLVAIKKVAIRAVVTRSEATRQSTNSEAMDCRAALAMTVAHPQSLGARQPGQDRQPPTPSPKNTAVAVATAIAQAAKRLSDLRDNWLNPPEWTHKVPEVTPLGMDTSPYPDRIEPKPGITAADLQALQQRTLTKLYNTRPAWLSMAHQQLDAAVAAAYGWTDYTPDLPDEEILKRLLALNLQRSA
jgi:hypothetical protein